MKGISVCMKWTECGSKCSKSTIQWLFWNFCSIHIFFIRLFIQWTKTRGQVYRPALTEFSALRKLRSAMKFEVSLQYEWFNTSVLQNKLPKGSIWIIFDLIFVAAFPNHFLVCVDILFSDPVSWHLIHELVTLVVNGTMRPFRLLTRSVDHTAVHHNIWLPHTVRKQGSPREIG